MKKQYFYYDDEKIQFVKSKYPWKRHMYSILFSIIIGAGLGYAVKSSSISFIFSNDYQNKNLPIGSQVWKDSVFADYERRADIYINLKYPKSPIKGGMLALAAYNTYDSTGVLVPVEFALAQAQLESSMGTEGRSPINNPYNVGEWDDKTVLWFDDTFSGVQAYYFLVVKKYLSCKSLDMLFKNFTNCNGHRYASKPTYEIEIEKQYYYIQRVIDKEIQKKSKK